MNWMALGALLAGVVNALAALANNWLDKRRSDAGRRAQQAERSNARLVRGILARRGAERRADAGGMRDPENWNDGYRRD